MNSVKPAVDKPAGSSGEAADSVAAARHAQRMANLRPFKKGQSGNPSGRSKTVKKVEQIAVEASEKALRRITQLINSKDERVALAAAQAVLDRSMGKPVQKNENTNTEKKESADFSDAELAAIARLGSARADTPKGRTKQPH